mmetsp:Transcript_57516/g.136836  ORF Transcript_57516/g.136836 Transcript_57516/m.136836 type:complete len:231 (-) Transcript_57516:209-901(-)
MAASGLSEEKAAEASGGMTAQGSSSETVALLLNFLKQYYIAGEEQKIRAMLKHVASHRLQLGNFGTISQDEVSEACVAFDVWKSKGFMWMPVRYSSGTPGDSDWTPMPGQVVGRNADGSVDIHLSHGNTDERLEEIALGGEQQNCHNVRHEAVRMDPRPVRGYFVPEPAVQRIVSDFAGSEYGDDYLTLEANSRVYQLEKDDGSGWAKGFILRGQECLEGWYPAQFGVPA